MLIFPLPTKLNLQRVRSRDFKHKAGSWIDWMAELRLAGCFGLFLFAQVTAPPAQTSRYQEDSASQGRKLLARSKDRRRCENE